MHKIEPGTAQVLKLALQGELMQQRISEWSLLLDQAELSEESLRVFIALHWLTPRDPRVTKASE